MEDLLVIALGAFILSLGFVIFKSSQHTSPKNQPRRLG
jgi:hypothetical protein